MAVVARAREVLQRLENETASPVRLDDLPLFSAAAAVAVAAPTALSKVEADLRTLDLDGMSPREAMDVLYRLRSLLI
jgi:DNA mismatch repair protein MutS